MQIAIRKAVKDTDYSFDSRTGYDLTASKSSSYKRKKKSSDENPDKNGRCGYLLTEFTKTRKYMIASFDFTTPRLATGKEWFIEYYFRIPGTEEYKRFKERFEMNRIKNLKDRKLYAEEALQFVKDALNAGFNPFTYVGMNEESDHRILAQLYKIKTAMSEQASKIAAASYNEHYNRFERYITARKLQHITMAGLTIEHAKGYRKWMESNGMSKKTINASLSYMAMFYREGIERKLSVHNHFLSVSKVKRESATNSQKEKRFEPINTKELSMIFKAINAHDHKYFHAYLAMIYYAWARPSEILRIKIADIDLQQLSIRFRSTATKNKQSAFVQIVPPLAEILSNLQLHKENPNDYLFGEGFRPSSKQLGKNNPNHQWRDIVKKQLRIDKDMYALKHTGNIEYLLNNKGNVDIKWQQKQNRHSSPAMTERYNRKLGAYFIDLKEVIFTKI